MSGAARSRSPSTGPLDRCWAELHAGLSDSVREFLSRTHQGCPHFLGSLDDLGPGELRVHLNRASCLAGGPPLDSAGLDELAAAVPRLGAVRTHCLRRSAAIPVETRAARGLMMQREAAQLALTRSVQDHSLWGEPPVPKGGRWPTHLARARAEASGLGEAEAHARAKYISLLTQEVRVHNLPIVSVAGSALGGGDRLDYLAAGKRTGTLRRRLGDWARLQRWLVGQGLAAGLPSATYLIDYLEARAAEPCGKTVLRSALEAVRFFETVGGTGLDSRVSHSPLVTAAVIELTGKLSSQARGERRQAHYIPVQLIVAMERMVLDDTQAVYVRYYAWLRLIKYWASLRFDDLRWVDPATVVITAEGLRMNLTRTKVTGPGKKVGTLTAFVSTAAYYECSAWLACGVEVRMAHFARIPFMFPLPTGDLQAAVSKPGDYSDASAASQALFSCLVGPQASGERLSSRCSFDSFRSGTHLLPPGAGLFWAEHSERNGLPSAAAALKYSDDTIRRLGRWQAGSVTEAYVRTSIAVIAEVQGRLAVRVRGRGSDFLDEGATFRKLEAFLQKRGMDQPDVDLLIKRLLHFGGADKESARSVWSWSWPDEPTEPAGGDTPGLQSDKSGSEDSEDVDVQPEVLGGYVVSIVGRGRFRRLHHLARCHLVPGTDYKEFVLYGECAPEPSLYDEICSRCWRRREEFHPGPVGPAACLDSASSSGESTTSEAI